MSTSHAPADVIAQLLIANALGTDPELVPLLAWPVFVSDMSDGPDELIAVFDTAGKTQGRYMKTGFVVERPGLLIAVRARLYPDGYQKANDIKLFVDQLNDATVIVDSTTYVVKSISRTSTVVPLGEGETRNLEEFSLNIIPVIT